MKNLGPRLDRLLRAAATAPNEPSLEMPFGFDTRVLAGLRAESAHDALGLTRLLRRVTLMSLAVMAIAGTAAYRELSQPLEPSEPFTDDYAIADSAIGFAFEE